MSTKKHVFTTTEKKCFSNIVKKYGKVIESKNTDSDMLKSKNEAWDKVTAEFNASPLASSKASHKQLRRLWMNLKQRQRVSYVNQRPNRLSLKGRAASTTDADDPDIIIIEPPPTIKTEIIIEDSTNDTSAPQPTLIKTEKPYDRLRVHHIPPISILSSQSISQIQMLKQCTDVNIMEKEYNDRRKRSDEKHVIELAIFREHLREAKAKADLAEVILMQRRNLQGI